MAPAAKRQKTVASQHATKGTQQNSNGFKAANTGTTAAKPAHTTTARSNAWSSGGADPISVSDMEEEEQHCTATVPLPAAEELDTTATANAGNVLATGGLGHMTDSQGLVLMLLSIEEGGQGSFNLWGLTPEQRTVLVRVTDYEPYFYISLPSHASSHASGGMEDVPEGSSVGVGNGGMGFAGRQGNGSQNSGGGVGEAATATGSHVQFSPAQLRQLQQLLSSKLPSDLSLTSVRQIAARPIMYFRPKAPEGGSFLRLALKPGSSTKRASAVLSTVMKDNTLARHGWLWRTHELYEHDSKIMHRFLTDTLLAAGAWVFIPSASLSLPVPVPAPTPAPAPTAGHGGATSSGSSGAATTGHGCASNSGGSSGGGYRLVPPAARRSACEVEVTAPWTSMQPLSPDATQLADPDWAPPAFVAAGLITYKAAVHDGSDECSRTKASSVGNGAGDQSSGAAMLNSADADPPSDQQKQWQPAPELPPSVLSGLRAAFGGGLVPLRVLTLDVQLTTHDCTARMPLPTKQDPIVCIACDLHTSALGATGSGPDSDPGSALGSGSQPGSNARAGSSRVVFVHAGTNAATLQGMHTAGASLRCFDTESALLLGWLAWVQSADPDVMAVYQVRDTLGAIRDRFVALSIEGGSVALSRWAGSARTSNPMTVRSVVQYNPAWVKSQSRMAGTSNQETFLAEIPGRLVVDVLRQVLTSQSLATFTLVDCAQSILNERLEVLGPLPLAALWCDARAPPSATAATAGATAAATAADDAGLATASALDAAAETQWKEHGDVSETVTRCTLSMPGQQLHPAEAVSRLARYSLRRVDVVKALMERLSTLSETFEMARVTGLTATQVAYNAQMIRTWSLLHRNAHRHGYIIGGRQEATNLIESPYLMHPVECRTVGLYREPVVTLDFASLYPSLYRAYNLCYTTLVHPEDVAALGADNVTTSPTGHSFVKPSVRPGILPAILTALLTARARTRELLKTTKEAGARAVLDSRQKALKLAANALYGFTGAQTSMLQCVPLADSCLALGAASCKRAIDLIGQFTQENRWGPTGVGAKVIYGQTDSLFIHFPRATPEQAVALGKQAAALVTASFPQHMELKYEKVSCPFMLLHVNRYAGHSFETAAEAAAGTGTMMVKGLKAIWRQSAPILSRTLYGALERILMSNSVPAAVAFVEEQVRRLLTGKVEMWELVMTGGLWRVTGQQVANAAAGGEVSKVSGDEDVRGPHATLAVKLSQRDPGRHFVLGERISYVLLSGPKLQDDAAEDPLTASQIGAIPNYKLYWENKLQTPLKEVFETCLPPQQLHALLTGPHTKVLTDKLSATETDTPSVGKTLGFGLAMLAAAGQPLSPGPSSSVKGRQAGLGQFFKQQDKCIVCRVALPSADTKSSKAAASVFSSPRATPASRNPFSPPSTLKGGAVKPVSTAASKGAASSSNIPSSPKTPQKRSGGGLAAAAGKGKLTATPAAQQMVQLTVTPRHPVLSPAMTNTKAGAGGAADAASALPSVPPAICASCLATPDVWANTYLAVQAEANSLQQRLGLLSSECMSCHSGGLFGAIACENGECPVLHGRMMSLRLAAAAEHKLTRLDVSEPW